MTRKTPKGLPAGFLDQASSFETIVVSDEEGEGSVPKRNLTSASLSVRFLSQPQAVDRILTAFLVVAGAGSVIDLALLGLWLADRSGESLLGIAGLAQALILIGVNGIVAIIAADYSRETLGW